MVKNISKHSKTKGSNRNRQIARKKAKSQAMVNKRQSKQTVKNPKDDTTKPSDVAPLPTNDNCNSHSSVSSQSHESTRSVNTTDSNQQEPEKW